MTGSLRRAILGGMTTRHIAKPPVFSFEEAMRYTTRGFDDPRYVVGERSISTAIAGGSARSAEGARADTRAPGHTPDTMSVIRVADAGETLAVEVLRDGAGGDAGGVERYVRR